MFGISCGRYGEQFKALLIAIETDQPSLAKSTTRKEEELKKLSCSLIMISEAEVHVMQKEKRGLSIFRYET